MPSPPPPVRASRLASFGLALGLAWLGTVAWQVATGPLTHGFAAYFAAARALRGGLLGAWIYDEARFIDFVQRSLGTGVIEIFGPNTPAMALLALPVASWPTGVARGAWLGVSLLAWGWTVRAGRTGGAADRWRVACLSLVLLVMPAVTSTLRTAQAYLLIAAVLAAAAWRLRARHDVTGGALLGVAIVTKTAGLALLPVLAVRGRWRALAALATVYGAGIVATLGGDGLSAWTRYPSYVRDFALDPRTMVTAYQSTSGLVRHLCVADARWNPSPAGDCAPVAWIAPLLVLLAAVVATCVLARRATTDDAPWPVAAALTLSVLLIPAAEDHQFVQLAAPALLVAASQHTERPWWPWVVFVALLYAPLALAPADVPAGWAALAAYPRLAAAWWLWGLVLVEARVAARGVTGAASA